MPDVHETVSIDIKTSPQELERLISLYEKLISLQQQIGGGAIRGAMPADTRAMVLKGARGEIAAGQPGQAASEFVNDFQATIERTRAQAIPRQRRMIQRQQIREALGTFDPKMEADLKAQEESEAFEFEGQRNERDFRRRTRTTRSLDRQRERELAQAEVEAHRENQEIDQAPIQEAREQYRQVQAKGRLLQRIASRTRRGIDPKADDALRAEVGQVFGIEDELAITGQIQSLQQEAEEKGFLNPRGKFASLGKYGPALALGGYQAAQLGTAFASAKGSGEPFRPEENLSSILPMLAVAAGLAIPGVGWLETGMLVAGAGVAGGIPDIFNRNKRELSLNYASVANLAGMQPDVLKEAVNRWGPIQGYTGDISEKTMLETIGATQASRMGGATQEQSIELARSLLRRGEEAAPDIAKSLAPFLSNPFLFDRASNTANLKRGGLDSSDVTEMTLTAGPEATMEAFRRLGMNRRADQAQALFRDLKGNEYEQRNAGSFSAMAQASLSQVSSSGAPVDSSQMQQAQASVMVALQGQRTAIEHQVQILERSGRPHEETAAQINELRAKAAALSAAMGQFAQNILIQSAERRAGRLETAATITGIREQREQFGLQPGAVAPSLRAFAEVTRARIAEAERTAADTRLPEEQREAARVRAEQGRSQLLETAREELRQRYAVPAQVARSYAGRELAQIGQRQQFGADEVEMARLLAPAIQTAARRIGREQQNLTALEGAFTRGEATIQEVEGARNSLQEAQLQRNALTRQSAFLRSDRDLRQFGYRQEEQEAGLSYRRSLGLGPQSDLTDTRSRVSTMLEQRQLLTERAQVAFDQGDTVQAETLRSQANVLGTAARSTLLEGLGTFRPSAKDSLRMGQLGTAIDLAKGDLSFGGQVPTELRQQMLQSIFGQLSQIDSRVNQAPEGPERDAVAAALFPQKSSLLMAAQEQRNALQFGDMGRMINLSVGAPGDFTFAMPTVAEFQRINPGGTKGLGGTGEDIGLSDVQKMALSTGELPPTLGQAMGGSGSQHLASPELVQALNALTEAIRQQKPFTYTPQGSASTSPAQRTNTDPFQAASGLTR